MNLCLLSRFWHLAFRALKLVWVETPKFQNPRLQALRAGPHHNLKPLHPKDRTKQIQGAGRRRPGPASNRQSPLLCSMLCNWVTRSSYSIKSSKAKVQRLFSHFFFHSNLLAGLGSCSQSPPLLESTSERRRGCSLQELKLSTKMTEKTAPSSDETWSSQLPDSTLRDHPRDLRLPPHPN